MRVPADFRGEKSAQAVRQGLGLECARGLDQVADELDHGGDQTDHRSDALKPQFAHGVQK